MIVGDRQADTGNNRRPTILAENREKSVRHQQKSLPQGCVFTDKEDAKMEHIVRVHMFVRTILNRPRLLMSCI